MKRIVLSAFLLCSLIALMLPGAASAQSIPNWAVGVSYSVGSLVMYQGVEYKALQANVSEVGWDPIDAPALWQQVGSGSSCTTIPSTPTGLTASGTTSSGTNLSWSAVTFPTGCSVSYKVLQGATSIATPTATSDAVTGLSPSTAYSFTVEATDAAGTSAASSAVSVTTLASSGTGGTCGTAWSATAVYTSGMTASLAGENYVANYWTQNQSPATNSGGAGSGQPWTATGACSTCSTVPSVPTGLAASGTTSSSTNLSWTADTTPTGCTVSYKVLQGGSSIATPTAPSDAVSGLSPSTTYSFTVEATDAAGTSAASSALSVKTSPSSCTTKPSAPTGLTASGATSSTANLSWTAVSAPSGCTISYSISGGPSTLTSTTASDVESGLAPSTTYTFTVVATDYAGTSPGTSVNVTTTAPSTLIVGGWFEEWSIYYAGYNIANMQTNGVASKLTHLFYAFSGLTAPTSATAACVIADSYADYQKLGVPQVTGPYSGAGGVYGNFGAIQQLKAAYPNLKTIISIGGANAAAVSAFTTAASTAAGRTALASSCINIFIQGNIASGITAPGLFDGINIDWEFPTPTDTTNFTALLTEFRRQLTALTATTGKTYQLTFDAPAGPSDANNPGGFDTIDIPGTFAQSDFVTIDGYNYAGDWELATNDASPIYDDAADPLNGTGNTIDATVNYYLAKGVPAYKYTMGFPAYGAGWTGGLNNTNCGEYQNATAVSPVPNANGAGVCSTGNNQSSPAAGCDTLLTNGLATYGTIKNLLSNGYTACYDSTRIATSAFNPTTQTVFSYDDATSIAAKATYIKAHGLGGGYVWAVKDDDANGTIVKALAAGLNP
ncbi:glycosyl hydrolase family 18 protein [Tunturibacter empetritectus]|uniref:chitinase n=1 Tax=Tunturiibacter empetritectus TaxID=3069691 RepID=A0A7W8MR85_9BACT|nr:glycosyl hydrolase family 18 protein [Edaphobacter lichenicola]MBB5317368.1 chitinase [Edaphobacter lichenicola]